jgi:secondary thiamine-phosphate synthase enzyme
MQFYQIQLQLPAFSRGYHIITREVEEAATFLTQIHSGMLQVFIQHTSASLSINENADPSVRHDFSSYFNQLAPENAPYYTHTQEGPDDMPAHLKSALLGNQVLIPITNGKLNLGTWQGIYLGEHRNNGGRRKLIISAWGN